MIFGAKPDKEEVLRKKMASLGVREDDLRETFVHSGGKGGQKVNKASTCVYLKHAPTGLEVKCQRERSQVLNRYLARKILADKIESMVMGRRAAIEKKREKIRRQKRRRSRRAKEKMLKNKKMRSEKKVMRRPPGAE